MKNSKVKEAKHTHFISLVQGIFLSFLACWVTAFGLFIGYLAIIEGGKGEAIGDVAVLGLLGAGIVLLSVLVWKGAVREFKKAKEMKAYLAEHEGDAAEEQSPPIDRGRLMGSGLSSLAVGIFGIVWIIDALESGVPIWFAAMGAFIGIAAGAKAVSDLTDAAQVSLYKAENSEEHQAKERPKIEKRVWIGVILTGVLGIYDAVSFGMAFARGISAKALPLILLGNAVIILTVIVQTGIDIKALYRRKREKSE